jgi:hypothetical protein
MDTLRYVTLSSANATRANIYFGRSGVYAAFAMGERTDCRTFTEAKDWCIARGATTLEYDGFTIVLINEERP